MKENNLAKILQHFSCLVIKVEEQNHSKEVVTSIFQSGEIRRIFWIFLLLIVHFSVIVKTGVEQVSLDNLLFILMTDLVICWFSASE